MFYVLQTTLDKTRAEIERLRTILSADEQARADAFHFERDARRYIVARATLRSILAQYLTCTTREIIFSYTAAGKPHIDHMPCAFNVSHSHEIAVYAITRKNQIGIDMEYTGSAIQGEKIAQRYFSQREYEVVVSTPPLERHHMFIRIWTIKEAYLKATGRGIAGLESIEVMCDKEGKYTILDHDDDSPRTTWFVQQLHIAAGYIGTCVVEC